MCQIHKKLVKGELWAEVMGVTTGVILRFYLVCAKSYETIFFGVIFHSVGFFALEVMRGHDLWTHLQTCTESVDLLPPILES